jgi:hypothetical protein
MTIPKSIIEKRRDFYGGFRSIIVPFGSRSRKEKMSLSWKTLLTLSECNWGSKFYPVLAGYKLYSEVTNNIAS